MKNNNNQTHVATPIEIVNEVESAVLIDQQNALLRGVNIGMKHHPLSKGNCVQFYISHLSRKHGTEATFIV